MGRSAGLDAVGVAAAEPFLGSRADLEDRKAAGLHGGMAFTYRNPTRSTSPGALVAGAASLVVGAQSYYRRNGPPIPGRARGRVARYAWTDTYAPLRAALGAVASCLVDAGYRTRVLVDDNGLVDREAAVRAGLGWYGKNANVLLPGRGSWFVLGSVVTDAPLVPAGERVADRCGGCSRCLGGCPTGAIVAPGIVDARRCLAWLVQTAGPFPEEFREALGDRMYGCDDCQEVCPLNRPEAAAAPTADDDERTGAAVDVVGLLGLDDPALLAAAGSWYVPRRDARYLRRNALVVLGNTADPDDPDVLAALASALRHHDPLVRAHAVWAAARLGRPQLADGLESVEADPMVLAELRARGDVRARPAPAPS